MNFLGHLYLSGDDPLVITGNFMGDEVKGRDLSRFDPRIQAGIRLHRRIDSFTDLHRPVHAGRQRLREVAGHYAPVAMDLFIDHLLARDWSRWHPEPLDVFSSRAYDLLHAHEAYLPEATRRMLGYMSAHDWLSSYATLEGIGAALRGLSRRVGDGGRMAGTEEVLRAYDDEFTADFNAFLPAIKAHLSTTP
ncbi:MAG: DUF479 domain-containing protein [Flavobacteriales bacterium]|nr:DUF479 domain-containing protein [Flavobacteriales bacterium]